MALVFITWVSVTPTTQIVDMIVQPFNCKTGSGQLNDRLEDHLPSHQHHWREDVSTQSLVHSRMSGTTTTDICQSTVMQEVGASSVPRVRAGGSVRNARSSSVWRLANHALHLTTRRASDVYWIQMKKNLVWLLKVKNQGFDAAFRYFIWIYWKDSPLRCSISF